MQISKAMILIFSIFFVLLIGLTVISATEDITIRDTENNDIDSQTDSFNTKTDTINTSKITNTATDTSKIIVNDNNNLKSNTLKESSTQNINTNNLEKTASTNTYSKKSQTNTKTNIQNNEDETDDTNNNYNSITKTNNQNTNIQTTSTVNKLDNNNQETTTKTNTIKTTTNLKQANDDTDTIYINASYNLGSSDGTKEKPYTDINTGFNNIRTKTNIYIADGTYNLTDTITINKNINITGESTTGTILSGQNGENTYTQIMTINNGFTVNITNITFTNGKAQSGGAINNQGTLTVTNASFINNTATATGSYAYGGAIYNNGGTSTITSSSFINNIATGSSVYAYGGAIYNNGGTSTITSSSFINNTVRAISREQGSPADAFGGAIYNYGATSTITNSSFIKNTATSSATSNPTHVYGGAIYNNGGTSTITGSSFINNTVTATGSNVYDHGGAICNNGATLNVEYNIFLNNKDSNDYEIYAEGGTVTSLDYNWWGQNTTNYQNSPDNNNLKLTNYNGDKLTKWLYLNITSQDTWIVSNPVTLTTNLTGYYTSTGTTGTLTTEEAQSLPQNIPVTYTITQGTITDNTLLINGISTAIFTPTTTQTVTVTSTIYTNSTTLTKEVTQLDTVYVNASATTKGTGESWNSPVITIQEALDIVSDGGKIILAEGTYNTAGDYALTISQNVNITGQTQDKIIIDGLKMYQIMEIYNGYTVNITNITFTNGNATGGGVIFNDGNLTIKSSSFINVTAIADGVAGGAIYNTYKGNCTVIDSSFINNIIKATESISVVAGGAIYNQGTLNITNSNFINNTATSEESNHVSGGAINNDFGTCTITGSSFINNTVKIKEYGLATGGAIYNYGGTLTVISSSFINNTATTIGTSSNALGGAIYNDDNGINDGILTANYNIFLTNKDSNDYEIHNRYGTISSLDYNWWGQNTTNYQNSPYTLGLTNYNGDKLTKWLYLNMTTSTDTWTVGNPIELTTNLTGYYENTTATTGILTDTDAQKLPQNIPVTYTTTQGTITDNTLLINGISTAKYIPVISGENTITANIYTNNTSIRKTTTKIDTSITMKNINGTTKENITITAIITSNGNVLNTGTVTFTDTNGLTKTVDVINGVVTTNISYNKPGNYTITAKYNGDTMYSSSQTTATATIKTRDVNMNITITPTTTTANTTFNITIKDLDGNNVTDGTIYFYNNNTLIGNTTVINGTANYQYIFSKAGNYNITAVYNSTLYNSVNKTVQFTITKSDTKIVVNPITGTVQNTITLQANITDQYGYNVTDGKVVFKINGTTIKDSKGNPIYAYVTNGIATLQYTIPNSLTKDNLTIQAIYSGTYDTYNPSRNNNTINVTKRTADINLIITKNPVKATDTVTFMTIVRDSNGTIISNGHVVFKFNGKTIRDTNGNPILVNVTNGQAKLEYTIPNGISAKTYNITAVYANNDYNRAETNAPLTTEKIQSTITLQPTTITRGSNTTLLTGIIKDINGNLMVGTHKIEVKLNGKSIGTYTTTNGIINTNITIPNTLKNTNYTITVKIGDTNGYYGTNSTTTLTINNLKTFKQKVSI